MSIQRKIVPDGWPCSLLEAPPGPFVTLTHPDLLCFKSEYAQDDGRVKAFNSAGEYFCGEGNSEIVQPVIMIEEDDQ